MERRECTYYKLINDYKNRKVAIFGTTSMGKAEAQCVVNKASRTVDYYLVSGKSYKKEKEYNGIPVRTFDEIQEDEKKTCLVLVARSIENYHESLKILNENGFQNVYHGLCLCRDVNIEDEKEKELLIDSFGTNIIYDVPGSKEKLDRTVQIYAVTSHLNQHRASTSWNSEYIDYIQAGAALTDKSICEIRDDEGKSISEKNPYYNETTAGYWIANNDFEHDYVGLYHYSRGLSLDDNQIAAIVNNDVDVVLPLPSIMAYEMLSFTGPAIVDPVVNVSPDYYDGVEQYLGNKLFIPGNMMIAKCGIFKEYYDWLYSIQLYMEKEGVHKKNKRDIAYAAEALMNVYFMHHSGKYRIVFAKVKSLF